MCLEHFVHGLPNDEVAGIFHERELAECDAVLQGRPLWKITIGLIGTATRIQFVNSTHVSGACQMFRRECFEEIGGYVPVKVGAVDWIAVTTARMRGWQTRTFTEKVCFHHRKLGVGSGSHGKLHMRFHYGRKAYYVGGHPLWECLRGLFQVREKPFILGGLWFIAGYVWAALRRSERTVSSELMRFHRAEQMARLRALFTRRSKVA